jgi:hypothetical protein
MKITVPDEIKEWAFWLSSGVLGEEKKTILKNIKPIQICGICKCPLDKKAFTTKKGDCPLKKWEVVENSELFIQKNSKTII